MQYFTLKKEMVCRLIENMKKMRIKGGHQLTEMRTKCKKMEGEQPNKHLEKNAKLGQMGECGVEWASCTVVVFLVVCCSYPCWCILCSLVIAWWCKTLRYREKCLWTNMTCITDTFPLCTSCLWNDSCYKCKRDYFIETVALGFTNFNFLK